MAEIFIKDEDLTALKGKSIIVTGGSSGIGLASVKLFLEQGASVTSGDVQEPPADFTPPAGSQFAFHKTNVAVWADLVALFKKALQAHGGRVDHVFANAGISPRADYIELDPTKSVDPATGDPVEPSFQTIDVNLRGVINTATLAVHYMRRQQPPGGSVVVAGSIASMQRYRAVDYTTSKHGVLGFLRGMRPLLEEHNIPVRINATAPSYTRPGMVPLDICQQINEPVQESKVVAQAAGLLMADEARNGQVIRVSRGRWKEVEEAALLPAYANVLKDEDTPVEDIVLGRMMAAMNGVYRDA